MIAIYEIRNNITGRVYVGSSVDVAKRWRDHKSALKTGIHKSRSMQTDYSKHGLESFEHKVLEELTAETTKEQLLEREQFYLDTLQPFGKTGYNSSPTAGSQKGVVWTKESRMKLSAAHKGKKFSEESRRKMSEAHKGKPSHMKGEKHKLAKLTWEKVREIRRLYAAGGTTQSKLAIQFDISQSVVSEILNNKTWVEGH